MAKIKIHVDGEEYNGEIGNETVLAHGENAGLDLPYSCRGGICSTCMAQLISGTVDMDKNMVLTDQELEEGYILTCQSHVTSEEAEVTYDV